MKTGPAGRNLIKFFEGTGPTKNGKTYPYICPAGYWTIGYGSRFLADGTECNRNTPAITLFEAEELFTVTLTDYENAVLRNTKVQLYQYQFDALVSFVYNLGEGNFKSSTLLKKLNAGDFQGAADQFLSWDKSRVNGILTALPGLTKRRKAERALFLTPIDNLPPELK